MGDQLPADDFGPPEATVNTNGHHHNGNGTGAALIDTMTEPGLVDLTVLAADAVEAGQAPGRLPTQLDLRAAPEAQHGSEPSPAPVPSPARATVTLVVPTLNEEANVRWVLTRVPDRVDEIVVVDGHSTDGTVDAVLEVRPDAVVVQQRGTGKGAALRTAFAIATGDIIVMIDADGSMDPAEIESFVFAIESGYEFAKGTRHAAGGGSEDLTRLRRTGNKLLTSTVNMLFNVPFSDLCYGYVAFRRDRLEHLAITAKGFEVETEIAIHAVKAGLRIAEVPSVESCRRYGTSNLHTVRDGQRVLRTILRERFVRSQRPVVDCLQPHDLPPVQRHGATA